MGDVLLHGAFDFFIGKDMPEHQAAQVAAVNAMPVGGSGTIPRIASVPAVRAEDAFGMAYNAPTGLWPPLLRKIFEHGAYARDPSGREVTEDRMGELSIAKCRRFKQPVKWFHAGSQIALMQAFPLDFFVANLKQYLHNDGSPSLKVP